MQNDLTDGSNEWPFTLTQIMLLMFALLDCITKTLKIQECIIFNPNPNVMLFCKQVLNTISTGNENDEKALEGCKVSQGNTMLLLLVGYNIK